MANNLTLEQILEVVKKKYKDSKIVVKDDNKNSYLVAFNCLGYFCDTLCLENNFIIFYKGFPKETKIENNIIELKHYLDIDIEWEDLIEYIREIIDFEFRIKDGYFIFNNLIFYKNGNVETMEDYTIATNRSYWQMYNIIKNIVEN